jgi:hypothetical protein
MDDRARQEEQSADTSATFEFEENSTPASGPSSRRRRRGILVVMTLILAVILLLLAIQDASDQQNAMTVLTPGSSATQTQLARMSTPSPTALALAPTRCPLPTASQPQLGTISYYGAEAFGVPPIWMLGLQSQPRGRVVHFATFFPRVVYTAHGWRWRILLVSAPGFLGQIRLSGEQAAAGSSTSLLLDAGAGLRTLLVLNPHDPSTTDLGWAQWPIYVYLPGSGCYSLDAQWSGGRWQISFAAGS